MISHGKPNAKRNAPWPDPTEAQLRQSRERAKALIASQKLPASIRQAALNLLAAKRHSAEESSYAIEDAVDLVLAERHPRSNQ